MTLSDGRAGAAEGTDSATLELASPGNRGPWGLEVGTPEGALFVRLDCGERLLLGSGAAADLRLDDRAVSSRHAMLTATSEGVKVEDLDSTNGVYAGGARVAQALVSGTACNLVVGRTSITVRPFTEIESLAGEEDLRLPGIVGDSLVMRRLAREVRRIARLRCSVLVHGESGTGKDLISRALHTESLREGPYVPVNVGAIPETLSDAELFGHRRGAFTGAVASRPGAFEQADRGTLFLDEVAELSPHVQVKLLRVVEDGAVRPVGGEWMKVDVRIVSATWACLRERIREGVFREDLYHRLSTMTIEVPPLRQRRSDIPALARALLSNIERDVGERQLTSASLALLGAYSFPGNVRELGSVLYRAAVAADGPHIEAVHVSAALPRLAKRVPTVLSPAEAQALLERCGGNTSAAARAARVPRSTFRSWLDKAREDEPLRTSPGCSRLAP